LAGAVIGEAEEIPGNGLSDRRGAAKDLNGVRQNGNGRGGIAALDELFAFAQLARAGRPQPVRLEIRRMARSHAQLGFIPLSPLVRGEGTKRPPSPGSCKELGGAPRTRPIRFLSST